MGSMMEPLPKPWVSTPCVKSISLSRAAGCTIFLKLENLQPSGSFKSRGIGNLMLRASERHGSDTPTHFYCSSGGNAGLACATAAISLGKSATIVVPLSTNVMMVGKLKKTGAQVHQVGASWFDADTYLRQELLDKDPYGVYVPPFDHPDIWTGAATLIEELDEQIGTYDAVICSVGGGGLFCGLMEGLSRRKTGSSKEVKILTVETEGADSLARSVQAKKLITLPGITSIATSLGAIRVAEKAFENGQKENVTCLVFSDAEAAMSCVQFADDERILVEAACGVSIAPVYNGQLRKTLGQGLSDEQWKNHRIVITICGGNNINLSMLEGYREKYGKPLELGQMAEAKTRARDTALIVEKELVVPPTFGAKDEPGYQMPVQD